MRSRKCPARLRMGFTLLELLCIVVVVGLLASIAVSKFGQVKRRVAISTMKGDLHNLTSMAESHFFSKGTYEGFTPARSANVDIEFVAGQDGWIARATHPEAPDMVCSVGTRPGANAVPVCE